jgi:hypothetical protein
MPSNLTPPQPPLKWTHSADEIKKIVKEAIQAHRQLEDAVAQIPPEQCSFESVSITQLIFGRLIEIDIGVCGSSLPLMLYRAVITLAEQLRLAFGNSVFDSDTGDCLPRPTNQPRC